MKIYCITHKPIKEIEKLGLIPAGVGESVFPNNYIIENSGDNIAYKNKHYSETSFHYWIWKNILPQKKDNDWFGTCQYRRYFVKKNFETDIDNSDGRQGYYNLNNNLENLKNMLQMDPSEEWNDSDVILCKPWSVGAKKIKIFKRGFKSLMKDPTILFDKKKQNIKLHFDMHHGYGILDKAIKYLEKKDRNDFQKFVNENYSFNPHIMFIAKKKVMNDWFKSLFKWLFKRLAL